MFKLLVYIIFGLIVGGVYHNIGNSQTSIQNRNCLLIFICAAVAFSGVISVVNSFPKVFILFFCYHSLVVILFLCLIITGNLLSSKYFMFPPSWLVYMENGFGILLLNFFEGNIIIIINHRKKLL
jgi:hypothetical protein